MDKATEKRLQNLETTIEGIYAEAHRNLQKKLDDFTEKVKKQDAQKRKQVEEGKLSEEKYREWQKHQVFTGQLWEAKVKEAAENMTRANEQAAAVTRSGQMDVYAAGLNHGTYELEHNMGLDTAFTIVDKEAVERMLEADPQLLPEWKIDEPKDYVWNYNKVKSITTQALLQGKSVREIGDDLVDGLQTQNKNKMRMFARTAMTGAHNAGTMDAMHRAEGLGIKVRKKWLATRDARTRDVHSELNGQIRDIDEDFQNALGKIKYPGDPTADAGNVFNCRCTMTYVYPELDEIPDEAIDSGAVREMPQAKQMSFDDWMEAHQAKQQPEQPKETNDNPLKKLSEKTISDLTDYAGGEEFHLTQDQYDEISRAMIETENPMYRVEEITRTAEAYLLDEGDEFDFEQVVFEPKDEENGALRSFTKDPRCLEELLGELDEPVIYKTVGPTKQLPIETIANYDQDESLAYANGWEVVNKTKMTVGGKEYIVFEVQQKPIAIPTEAEQRIKKIEPKTLDESVNDYLKQGTKWREEVTQPERKAVADYGYNTMSAEANGYLRGEKDKYDKSQVGEIKQRVKLLDSAIEKGTTADDMITYRGVGNDYLGLDFSKPEKLVGRTIKDGAHMSTTGNLEVAEVYGRGVVFEMETPKGTHAAFVDLADTEPETYKKWYQEDGDAGNVEYLLPRDSEITITGYEYSTTKEGKRYLKLTGRFKEGKR